MLKSLRTKHTRPLNPKAKLALQIVQGWVLHPRVLLQEDEVTSVETPYPMPHSYRLNCNPSPALLCQYKPPDNQQTVCVDTSWKAASSGLPFLFEVARVQLFWAQLKRIALSYDDSRGGLNNHNPKTHGHEYLQLISSRMWTLNGVIYPSFAYSIAWYGNIRAAWVEIIRKQCLIISENCPLLNCLNLKTQHSLFQSARCPVANTTKDYPIGKQPAALDKDTVLQGTENTQLINKETRQQLI